MTFFQPNSLFSIITEKVRLILEIYREKRAKGLVELVEVNNSIDIYLPAKR